MASHPSSLAMVPFVSVDHMMKFIHHIGLEKILIDLADEVESDFADIGR